MSDIKKILLVSNAFYPEISPRSFRATELAKEFVRQGHKVVVYSKHRDFDYSDFLKEHPMEFRMWGKDRYPKVPHWKGRFGNLLSRGLSRLLLMLFEYPGIEDMFKVKKLLKNESGYDLMISFAVPYSVHWGVAWARTRKNPIAKTWVADCGDPYMGCKTDSYRKLFYFGYVEKWFMRKADFVAIPVESARDAYYPEFQGKIRVISQGFKFKIPEVPQVFQSNSIVSFAYAGGFIPLIRDPRLFLEMLTTIDADFRFYIFTNESGLLQSYTDILKNKLIVKSYIPREALLDFMSGMDFLINFDNNTHTALPSKLIDYAIAGRPILNVEKTPDKERFLRFISGDFSGAMPVGNINRFRIENVCASFLSLHHESAPV